LLAKVQLTLERVRDVIIPDSISGTVASIVDSLALKDGEEDPIDLTMHRKVMVGSEYVFTMLMVHCVACDFKTITTTYPTRADGHNVSTKEFVEGARKLASQLAVFLARQNAAKQAAKEAKQAKRGGKGSSSSKAMSGVV
jgi:hypothetical protein